MRGQSVTALQKLCLAAMVVAGALFGFATGVHAQDVGAREMTAQRRLLDYPDIHHPEIGDRGMVVSQSEIASRVGAEILRKGGNAVDAAVAVSFALAVVLPRAGNIGGDGFMLVRNAAGQTVALDFRSRAPLTAKKEMFLDDKGRESDVARYGYKAAAVPGAVAGLAHAHRRWGSMAWADLLAPAIRLADEGVKLTHDEAFAIEWSRRSLKKNAEATRVFYKAGGVAYRPGELFRQPDLAASLKLIAKDGAEAFYKGDIARKIAATMQAHDGLISMEDLAGYRAVEREPLKTTYRGYEVMTMPPPSGGGLSIVQSLNILQHFDMKSFGARSADATHVLAETMKVVYADRTRHIGDPDFVEVPVAGLTSAGYADQRAKQISMRRTLKPSEITPGAPVPADSPDTTQISIADVLGNVVSETTTLGSSYGSGAMIEGAGFLLNDQMKNFAMEAGRDAQALSTSPANALAPGKRMMSTMSPTIVLRDGKPWLVTGTPGGSTILNTILQILVNTIDHGMNVAEAEHAPRIHQTWRGAMHMERAFSPDTIRILKERGHKIELDDTMGSAQSIMIQDGVFYGAADPRRPGATAAAP
jgi:gamma-glutamyltranspeptidase / glutathione hydrolase